VVSDGLGGAIVAWDDHRAGGTTNDVYAQRVNATGAPQWAANGVVVCSATSWQQVPQIASDGANGAVLCWSDNRSGTPDVFVQRINGIGVKLWPAPGVQACTGGGAVVRGAPALVSDGTGGAIVAWQDARSGAGSEDLYARHFLATGLADTAWTASGVVVSTASGKQERMRAVPDGSGGVIVAWKDSRTDMSGDVYAQHLTNTGAVASGWSGNGVSLCMQSGGHSLDVAADGQGGALVVWQDHRGGSADIYAQHISGSGHIAFPTNGLVVCNEANMDQFPAVCADPNGGGIVVWGDNRNTATTKQDIYAIGLTGFSNLTATVTPAGWSEPVAARNAPDATVGSAVTSTTLTGNTSSTWFNFAGTQQGPYIAPTWSLRVLTDEEACCPIGVSEPEPSAIGTYIAINQGPTIVRGGRHTLTVQADGLDLVPESNEDDNEYRSQWVWTPLVVNSGTPNVREHPPEQGLFANPNCDGFKYTHANDVAWVVSEAPTSPGDDYDLYLFSDDATNSTTGFSNLLTYSDLGNTLTDFIVGHRTGTPATVLPATVGYAKDGGTPSVDQSDATGRSAGTPRVPAGRTRLSLETDSLTSTKDSSASGRSVLRNGSQQRSVGSRAPDLRGHAGRHLQARRGARVLHRGQREPGRSGDHADPYRLVSNRRVPRSRRQLERRSELHVLVDADGRDRGSAARNDARLLGRRAESRPRTHAVRLQPAPGRSRAAVLDRRQRPARPQGDRSRDACRARPGGVGWPQR
jgi:hypothetical protein